MYFLVAIVTVILLFHSRLNICLYASPFYCSFLASIILISPNFWTFSVFHLFFSFCSYSLTFSFIRAVAQASCQSAVHQSTRLLSDKSANITVQLTEFCDHRDVVAGYNAASSRRFCCSTSCSGRDLLRRTRWKKCCKHARHSTAPSLQACSLSKEAITGKIKHAIKHKTSPARLAQLLQPSLSFCFSL